MIEQKLCETIVNLVRTINPHIMAHSHSVRLCSHIKWTIWSTYHIQILCSLFWQNRFTGQAVLKYCVKLEMCLRTHVIVLNTFSTQFSSNIQKIYTHTHTQASTTQTLLVILASLFTFICSWTQYQFKEKYLSTHKKYLNTFFLQSIVNGRCYCA